jgi:hypothetical protein
VEKIVWSSKSPLSFPPFRAATRLLSRRIPSIRKAPSANTTIDSKPHLGILVHGDNHFIVRGPQPDRTEAIALARHWSVIRIGSTTPPELQQWSIRTREFREDLEWAVIVPGDGEISPAVVQLLAELSARGVPVVR